MNLREGYGQNLVHPYVSPYVSGKYSGEGLLRIFPRIVLVMIEKLSGLICLASKGSLLSADGSPDLRTNLLEPCIPFIPSLFPIAPLIGNELCRECHAEHPLTMNYAQPLR